MHIETLIQLLTAAAAPHEALNSEIHSHLHGKLAIFNGSELERHFDVKLVKPDYSSDILVAYAAVDKFLPKSNVVMSRTGHGDDASIQAVVGTGSRIHYGEHSHPAMAVMIALLQGLQANGFVSPIYGSDKQPEGPVVLSVKDAA